MNEQSNIRKLRIVNKIKDKITKIGKKYYIRICFWTFVILIPIPGPEEHHPSGTCNF